MVHPHKDPDFERDEPRHRACPEWDMMSKERQEEYWKMARKKAERYMTSLKSGGCFVCHWIVNEIPREELTPQARKYHLILCCDPDSDFNRRNYVDPV